MYRFTSVKKKNVIYSFAGNLLSILAFSYPFASDSYRRRRNGRKCCQSSVDVNATVPRHLVKNQSSPPHAAQLPQLAEYESPHYSDTTSEFPADPLPESSAPQRNLLFSPPDPN